MHAAQSFVRLRVSTSSTPAPSCRAEQPWTAKALFHRWPFMPGTTRRCMGLPSSKRALDGGRHGMHVLGRPPTPFRPAGRRPRRRLPPHPTPHADTPCSFTYIRTQVGCNTPPRRAGTVSLCTTAARRRALCGLDALPLACYSGPPRSHEPERGPREPGPQNKKAISDSVNKYQIQWEK